MKNNNEQFENFIRDFDTIKMTTAEKNEIRENLEFFASTYIPQQSPYFHYVSFFKKSLAVTLIALLSFSASKPASAKALPGELFYNVKIIHEKIKAAQIKEPKEKVTFEIKRTETRIREAVQLAETKKLDASKQIQLAQDIKKHVKDIAEKIEEIKIENPEQALALNSDLKITLKINSEALKEVSKKKTKKREKTSRKNKKVEIIAETQLPIKEMIAISDSENEIELEESFSESNINTKTEEQIIILANTEKSESTPSLSENSSLVEKIIFNNNTISETVEIIAEPETKSFADFILDSIKNDIEETEIINDIIEMEIIAEEEIEVLEEEVSVIEEAINIANDIDFVDDIDIESEMTNDIIEKEIIAEEEIEILAIEEAINIANDIDFVDDIDIESEIINDIIEKEIIVEEEIDTISDLKTEITSLEHIILAEEKLKLLLLELSKERDLESNAFVQEFIREEKFGQAYIAVQNEIEKLSELKLERKLKNELGINIE